jgi:hypothetical protein
VREVVVMRWCDACHQEDTKTAASSTFTVGIVAGESRPALKLLELCERHEKQIVELQLLLQEVGQTPDVPPRPAAPTADRYARSSASEPVSCPVCGKGMTGAGLLGHVWGQHRTDERPDPPKVCPECRLEYNTASGCAVHRRNAHGFDPVAEALSGVKGYRHG